MCSSSTFTASSNSKVMFIFFYPNNLGCLVVAICKRFANNIGEIFIFFITAATTLHSCPNIATTVTEEVQAVGQPKIKNTSVMRSFLPLSIRSSSFYDFFMCGCVTYFQKCISHIGRDTSLRACFGMSFLIDRNFKSSMDMMSVACLSQNAHVFFIRRLLSIPLAVAFAAIATTIPPRYRVGYALNFSLWVITFRKMRKKKKKEEKEKLWAIMN
jgi:hypothetical protein